MAKKFLSIALMCMIFIFVVPLCAMDDAECNRNQDGASEYERKESESESGEAAAAWALSTAIVGNHASVVKLLLAGKVDPNVPISTEHGVDVLPLWLATDGTKDFDVEDRPNIAIDVVEVLLKGKADIEMLDGNRSMTLLGRAAKRGDSEVVSLLLKHKAGVDTVDVGGRTPLLYAANHGHAAVVALLLESKANLESEANIEARRRKGTPLILAAAGGTHLRVMRSWISKRPGVSEKSKKKERYLYGIKETEELAEFAESVELLLDHGANIHVRNEFARTVLEIAVRGECTEIIQLLVMAGAWDGKEVVTELPEMCAAMQEAFHARQSVEKQDWLPEKLLEFFLLRESLEGQPDEVIPDYLENPFFALHESLPIELNKVIDGYATQYTTNELLNRRIRKLIAHNRRVSEERSEQKSALSVAEKQIEPRNASMFRVLSERMAANARAVRRLFE